MAVTIFKEFPRTLGWVLLCLASAIAACSGSADNGGSKSGSDTVATETAHPTAENIPHDSTVADVIDMSSALDGTGRLTQHALRLRVAEEIFSIGALDGQRHEVIGRVKDVVVGKNERIYLLDSRYSEVRVYDPDGTFVRSFGGSDQDSTGLQSPIMMDFTSEGKLAVTDRGGLTKLFVRKDASLMHQSTITLDRAGPQGRCIMGDTIYAHGVGGSEISEQTNYQKSIRAYSMEGKQLAHLGKPYKANSKLVQFQLSMGPLACSTSGQMLISAFSALPVLFGYSDDGELKWKSKLAGFIPPEIKQTTTEGGRPAVTNDPTPASSRGKSDYVKALVAAPDGHVIVQTGRRTNRSVQAGKRYAKLHTYLIDANTGKGVYVGSSLPPIYDVTAERVYAGVNAPFPQVKVYRLPAGGV